MQLGKRAAVVLAAVVAWGTSTWAQTPPAPKPAPAPVTATRMGVVLIIFPAGEYGNLPPVTQAGRRFADQTIRATEMSQTLNRSVFDWSRVFVLLKRQWQQSWLWTTSRTPLSWSHFS